MNNQWARFTSFDRQHVHVGGGGGGQMKRKMAGLRMIDVCVKREREKNFILH